MKKPIIDLRYTMGNDPGLIVICSSGVRYTNQTGGTACLSPIEEGVYLPFFDDLHDQGAALMSYFADSKIYTTGTVGINEIDTEFIDSILNVGDFTKYLKTDRERLQESHEAWLYVNIYFRPEISDFGFSGEITKKEQLDTIMSPLYGFNGCKGVLTWINSD